MAKTQQRLNLSAKMTLERANRPDPISIAGNPYRSSITIKSRPSLPFLTTEDPYHETP